MLRLITKLANYSSWFIPTILPIIWAPSVAFAQDETLRNDGFASGDPVSFQAGFVSGEIAAARFEPSIPCPCMIDSLTVLFGGSTDTVTMGIQIWDDPGGVIPGTLLYTGKVAFTGSTNQLQQIDLSSSPIVITQPFRVGLEFNHSGLPGVATDADGTIDATANFILADLGGVSLWFSSFNLGVSGDFVMRADISDIDADGDGVIDTLDNCTLVDNPEQVDNDADGYGNLCDSDFNDDCSVNFLDLGLMRTAFFAMPEDANWNAAIDLNADGVINVLDLGLLRVLFFSTPGPSGVANQCQ